MTGATIKAEQTETIMEFTHLSLPPQLAQYAGIVSLLLLWNVCRRKRAACLPARTVSAIPVAPRPRAPRHPLVLPVELEWDVNFGKGVTRNLSMQGCRMKTDVAPAVGTYASVKFLLQRDECLAIELAVVRWVLGEDVGLEFLSVSAIARQRLHHLLPLERHATTPVH
jgi:hypothetical protein